MHTHSSRVVQWCLVVAVSACNVPDSEGAVSASGAETSIEHSELRYSRRYEITVRNVTAANVLSPPLVVVHSPDEELFRLGDQASPGIAAVAETGATATLQGELQAKPNIKAVFKAAGGPVFAGQTRTIEIAVPSGTRNARLNLIAMIGRSNDSFVSRAEGFDLVFADFGPVMIPLSNFDAGSEEDTGNVEDFGAGGHPVADAEGLISVDRGLNLRGNAPEKYGWGSTAAMVRIERKF